MFKLFLRNSLQSIKQKITTICQTSGQLTQEELIGRLNPALRGWANYHRHIICGVSYGIIHDFLWHRLMRWGKRRHPSKSGLWIVNRYFHTVNGQPWTFHDPLSGSTLVRLNGDIQTYRHIKIKGEANPFDFTWNNYFQDRENSIKMKASSHYIGKVLKQQYGRCLHCHQLIQVEQEHKLYHLDGNKQNRRVRNMLIIHEECKFGFEYVKSNSEQVHPAVLDVCEA